MVLGHAHTVLHHRVGKTFLLEDRMGGHLLGQVDLVVGADGVDIDASTVHDPWPIVHPPSDPGCGGGTFPTTAVDVGGRSLTPDPAALALISTLENRGREPVQRADLRQPGVVPGSAGESELGNWMADAMLAAFPGAESRGHEQRRDPSRSAGRGRATGEPPAGDAVRQPDGAGRAHRGPAPHDVPDRQQRRPRAAPGRRGGLPGGQGQERRLAISTGTARSRSGSRTTCVAGSPSPASRSTTHGPTSSSPATSCSVGVTTSVRRSWARSSPTRGRSSGTCCTTTPKRPSGVSATGRSSTRRSLDPDGACK